MNTAKARREGRAVPPAPERVFQKRSVLRRRAKPLEPGLQTSR